MKYCLDTNVFITPSNLYYPMDFSPAYWNMIDEHIASGTVFIIDQVYQELTKGKSDVCDWIKDRKNDTFVKEFYDEDTQNEFRNIADFVQANYKTEVAAEFLSGADSWLIAVCKVHHTVLVTNETFSPSKKKVKIPNICKEFEVDYINDFEMIRKLNAKFVLEKS